MVFQSGSDFLLVAWLIRAFFVKLSLWEIFVDYLLNEEYENISGR